MISRRRFTELLSSIGAMLSLTGCVGTRWWEDDEGDNGSTGGAGSNTDTESREREDGEEGSESADSTDTSEQGTEGSAEDDTANEDTEERQQEPNEEETEIDRDEYEHQEVSETEARSSDDIEIYADSQVSDDGSATVTGTVTNVSNRPIDAVDLEVVFYGAGDEYLSAQLVTITDLGADESKQFDAGIAPDGARGQPERVEINSNVYDRAD